MDPQLQRRLEARLGDGRASGYPDPKPCWEWQMARDKHGYGQWTIEALGVRGAHRAVWLILRGDIPDGLVLDHKCHNRACVNPDHLRLVSRRINAIQNNLGITARNAYKTECKLGHPIVDHPYMPGKRYCATCAAEANRQNQRRRLAAGIKPQTPVKEWCKNHLHRLLDENGEPTRELLVRKDGRRECRGCHRERERGRLERLRLASR